ncbi:arylsulfatase [Verrucomicrobiales bacterium]|jgi:arylsulfatase|nr:arylsulfatase [Verrucomicrobiales bacterium]MDF1785541.1 arylsulfatase [Verrucomicrobiales bacterium]NCF86599.1 sulfatase-like hydrolase/transferase [Verrucomicrobiaceae bacterium]
MKFLFAFVLLVFIPAAVAQDLKGSRPNIILFMTDDQGMGDLSCLGNPLLKTPNLDRFYKVSTRFTEFHVSPTCAPTRSALLSGRHEFRNGVTHTIKERERMALSTTTFPQLLQKAGYGTGIFGKWHLGDEDAYQPYNRGFSEVFIHGAGGIGQSYPGSCADFPPNRENRYFDCHVLQNDTIVKTKGFCTDVFFHGALGWIKAQREANKSHFAYISTNAPHGPMIAPESYKKRFLDLGYDGSTAGRYGMIENIDDNFGKLMEKLDEWEAWDDTLVIFMTDNGQAGRNARRFGERTPLFTAGFKTGKGSPYEGGTHVPAFWRWKGVLGEGVDIPALTAHIDLFNTFSELCGADIPGDIQKIDGRSMLTLLKDPKAPWKDRLLYTHKGRWEKGADPNLSKFKSCAVRSQRWRFVNNKELYDLAVDPYEMTNVIEKYPQVVAEFRKAYDQWWEETLPLMVNEEVPFAPHQPQTVRYEKQLKDKGIPDWEVPTL